MTATVPATPAADPGIPPDLAIDTVTGEIGTVAELEAAAVVPELERAAVVKPGEKPADAPAVAAVKPPPVVAGGAAEKTVEEQRIEAAARLRASGAARRKRAAEEAALRGHAQTLEQRLAAEQRAREAAEALAARDPLDVLKERGQVGKAFQQAAIDENTPEAKIARLQRELAETRGTIETWQQQQAREREEQTIAAGRDRFATYAAEAKELGDDGKPSDVAAFPHVAAHLTVNRAAVISEAERLFAVAQRRGHRPTWDDVLQEMQTRYERAATLAAGKPTEAATPADPPKAKPKGANGARTLTAKTQERAVAGPKRFEDMEVRNLSRDGGTDEQLEYIAELARREAAAGAR
jgi:hypothetical protein